MTANEKNEEDVTPIPTAPSWAQDDKQPFSSSYSAKAGANPWTQEGPHTEEFIEERKGARAPSFMGSLAVDTEHMPTESEPHEFEPSTAQDDKAVPYRRITPELAILCSEQATPLDPEVSEGYDRAKREFGRFREGFMADMQKEQDALHGTKRQRLADDLESIGDLLSRTDAILEGFVEYRELSRLARTAAMREFAEINTTAANWSDHRLFSLATAALREAEEFLLYLEEKRFSHEQQNPGPVGDERFRHLAVLDCAFFLREDSAFPPDVRESFRILLFAPDKENRKKAVECLLQSIHAKDTLFLRGAEYCILSGIDPDLALEFLFALGHHDRQTLERLDNLYAVPYLSPAFKRKIIKGLVSLDSDFVCGRLEYILTNAKSHSASEVKLALQALQEVGAAGTHLFSIVFTMLEEYDDEDPQPLIEPAILISTLSSLADESRLPFFDGLLHFLLKKGGEDELKPVIEYIGKFGDKRHIKALKKTLRKKYSVNLQQIATSAISQIKQRASGSA